jgi:hypothetical protein
MIDIKSFSINLRGTKVNEENFTKLMEDANTAKDLEKIDITI